METSCEENLRWEYLPDYLLLKIFNYLTSKELLNISLICKNWYRVSYDQILWKKLFYADFKIKNSIGIRPDKTSWFSEYKRLTSCIPVYETETIKEHTDQVLHVSFSHDGSMFATCSKDVYVLVWNSSHPVSVKYHFDMKYFSWQYTQFSQFNESDTLLLVSGVNFITSGEIAVFSLQDEFQFQCRVGNKPYDMFGTWYSDEYILSGGWRWLAHLVSASIIWLNKAQQETQSERVPVVKELFKFYNSNASSIRNIMIANRGRNILPTKQSHSSQVQQSSNFNTRENTEESKNSLEKGTEKLLIFTTASKSYTPHQIGFKYVRDIEFPDSIELGLSLKERVLQRQIEQEQQQQQSIDSPDELWDENEEITENFDKIDEIIDLHGNIIGMGLSPDHRYLYVNSRPWPQNYVINNPLDPPPIAQEIDIHVIDLETLKEVGSMFRSHRAYTSNDNCFFIFLDVSNEYVASGSEDNFAYIWDRHYGICLGRGPHLDVVNAVAFNPQDPEMLVSASDDFTIKIWRSYNRVKELGLEPSEMKRHG